MRLSPTSIDIWCAEHLSGLLGRHPLIDLGIQSFINHNVLGGFWFALVFFILWVWPSRATESAEIEDHQRLLFVVLGSLVAIAVALLLAASFSWLPPNRSPTLAHLYPTYLDANSNDSSFPSMSVALYASIAAGITSLRRGLGLFLWIVVASVALSRMYVGGHYLSDVIAGLAAALLGFAVVQLVEVSLKRFWPRVPALTPSVRLLTNIFVFAWILQVAVEFRDADWFVRNLKLVIRRLI